MVPCFCARWASRAASLLAAWQACNGREEHKFDISLVKTVNSLMLVGNGKFCKSRVCVGGWGRHVRGATWLACERGTDNFAPLGAQSTFIVLKI